MAKIDIPNIKGGFNLSKINDAIDTFEDHLNNKVLYRNNPTGEPNQMESDLDLNGKRIYNLPAPVSDSEPARLQDITDTFGGNYNKFLRVSANPVVELPDAIVRANKILAFDQFGDPTVATADEIDILRSAAGTSAERPSFPRVGFQYFDTTLGYPIWWKGSVWVNSSGTTVV